MRLLVGLLQMILGWPIWIRIILFVFIVSILWKLIRRPILWVLTIIPLSLKYIFRGIYRLLEVVIAMLHQFFGGIFYRIDNQMSTWGQAVDKFLSSWIKAFKDGESLDYRVTVILYIVCIVWLRIPTIIHTDDEFLNWAQNVYMNGEGIVSTWCQNYYEEKIYTENVEEQLAEESVNEFENSSIELVVFNVNTSLLVRDIPDMDSGIALARLYNEDRVIWTGETVFAVAENNRIEMWAKVRTEDDIEGWSRLRYLYPEDYAEKTFWIQER